MKTKTVLVHIDSSMYIFPEVAIDVKQVLQKSCSLRVGLKTLKNTCDGIIDGLMLTSFTGNFKGF